MARLKRDGDIYSPLPTATSIRLAKREGTDKNGLLKISLTVVDLNARCKVSPYVRRDSISSADRPPFHCLSYTWGNPHAYGIGFEDNYHARDADYADSNLTDIWCNGKILKIRKNLHDFFLQAPTGWTKSIRNRPHPDTGRILLHNRIDDVPAILHTYVGFGDNVNWQDNDGQTPLHHAARLGKLESVLILLKGGASIDIEDRAGQTAQDLATQNNHTDVSNALREAVDNGIDELVREVPPFTLESPDEYVWIDALCIDQTDVDERASQVEIMSQIYSSAQYVLVWLGEEDSFIEHGLSALAKLFSCADQYADSDLVPFRKYNTEDYERYSVIPISDDEWQGLAALFLRRWFRRIWIVQEAVFADAMIVYCGTKRIQWPELNIVAAALFTRTVRLGHDPSTSYIPINEFACGITYHCQHVDYLRETVRELSDHDETGATETFNFARLTYIGMPFAATDPRDKIYALLPLAMLKYGRELPLRPDYRMSVAECYARFTQIQLMESQNLKVLTLIPDISVKRVEGLPSWVPDYSISAAMPLRPNFNPGTSLDSLGGDEPDFSASKDWKQLSLKGVFIDVVADVAAPRILGNGPKKLELDRSWFDLLDSIQNTSRYDNVQQSLCEVLWRTLCADSDTNEVSPAPSTYASMFKRFICALVCAQPEINAREEENMRENAITLGGLVSAARMMMEPTYAGSDERGPDEAYMTRLRSNLSPITRSLDSSHFDCVRDILPRLESLRRSGNEACVPSTEEISEYFASGAKPLRLPDGTVHMIQGCEGFLNAHSKAYGMRRLFTTKAGYLGLGPASIEPGDGVWLVPGFGELMVLRQAARRVLEGLNSSAIARKLKAMLRDEKFEFVGEAYVHGIATSDALNAIGKGELKNILLV